MQCSPYLIRSAVACELRRMELSEQAMDALLDPWPRSLSNLDRKVVSRGCIPCGLCPRTSVRPTDIQPKSVMHFMFFLLDLNNGVSQSICSCLVLIRPDRSDVVSPNSLKRVGSLISMLHSILVAILCSDVVALG